jgi:hypothetical protein
MMFEGEYVRVPFGPTSTVVVGALELAVEVGSEEPCQKRKTMFLKK